MHLKPYPKPQDKEIHRESVHDGTRGLHADQQGGLRKEWGVRQACGAHGHTWQRHSQPVSPQCHLHQHPSMWGAMHQLELVGPARVEHPLSNIYQFFSSALTFNWFGEWKAHLGSTKEKMQRDLLIYGLSLNLGTQKRKSPFLHLRSVAVVLLTTPQKQKPLSQSCGLSLLKTKAAGMVTGLWLNAGEGLETQTSLKVWNLPPQKHLMKYLKYLNRRPSMRTSILAKELQLMQSR